MSDHVEIGAPSSRAPESALDMTELVARIEHTLDHVADDGRWAVLTWPVPRAPSERLLGATSEGDALLWAPPGEGEACALGAAFTLEASGSDRFQTIQQRALESETVRADRATATDRPAWILFLPAPRRYVVRIPT